MARPTVRMKVAPRSRVRVNTIPKFPAQVEAGDGISIVQEGGVYTFALAGDALVSFADALPFTPGDMFFASGSSTIDALPAAVAGSLMLSNGVGAGPSWSAQGAKGTVLTAQGAAAPIFAAGELNARACGATGDGASNDTTAVQSAINDTAYGTKYFPAGTYMLGHIDLVSGIKLKGDGAGRTIFKLRAPPAAGTDWFYALNKTDIEIEGITFDGNGFLTDWATGGHFPNNLPIMYLLGGSRFKIHSCEFKGWDNCGLLTNTAHDIAVVNNRFERTGQSAGYLASPTGTGADGAITMGAATFTSATANFQVGDVNKMIIIEGAGTPGVDGGRLVALITARNSANSVTINRNAIATVSGAGYRYGGNPVSVTAIEMAGTGTVDGFELRNFEVSGNRIINGSIGISGHDGVISRNIISGHSFGAGIHTQGLASNFNIVITDNVIYDGLLSQDTAGAHPGGIENWAKNSTVANNVIRTCPGPGISIGGRADVTGNVCTNNGQANTFLSSPAGFAGIAMFWQDATFNSNGSFVHGNICTDTQVSKTQEYGYLEHSNLGGGNGSQINVGFNYFSGNLTANTSLQSISGRTTNMATTVTIDAGGFSGGTFASPAITGANPLTLLNAGTGGFNLQLRPNTTMTANRTLDLVMGDADRVITLGGDVNISGQLVISGNDALTIVTQGDTNLTLPLTGTLATTTAPTFTGTVTINTSGNLNLRSSNASARAVFSVGRTASEAIITVDSTANESVTGSAAGDFVIRPNNNLFLGPNATPVKIDTSGVIIAQPAGLQIGASVPFSDSTGTLTLQHVDALDATTEATIEAAIDTLPNVTSVGALTIAASTASLARSGGGGVPVQGTNTDDDAAAGYKGEYVSAITTAGTATITVTIASPAVVSWTAHGMGLGSSVRFTTTGSLPTGITAGTTYWVIPVDANSFRLATSPANAVAGTAVNTSGSQSGTHTGISRLLLTTGVTTSYAFINLTAGDWDVFLLQTLLIGGTTVFTEIDANISLTLDTFDATAGRFVAVAYPSGTTLGSTGNISTQLSSVRIKRNANTIVYANAFATFTTSTIQAYGLLYARRMR